MGGAAPHLGMVLTKGSLSAYSIERDLKLQSNDRGCFWLHPSAQEFAPGDTMKLEWKVFPHRGREDFREKLRAFPRVILVDAEHRWKRRKMVFMNICLKMKKQGSMYFRSVPTR